MSENTVGSSAICQIAIVVKDIEKTARAYADLFGLPVPEVRTTDTRDVTNIRYRGEPTDARVKLAFFKMGEVSLELLEPVGEPSVWHNVLRDSGEGVHHIAFRVPDGDKARAALQARGIGVIQQGDFKGGGYTYVDSAPQMGVIFELLEAK